MDSELRKYDAIRAFEPEEIAPAIDRMAADPQFRAVLAWALPDTPTDQLIAAMRQSRDSLDFQTKFSYRFLQRLLAKAALSCDIDVSAIDISGRYTFVSNHRDIVLDSALLDKLLIDAGFATTCEIAIGDNLLAAQWIKDLVRINKSFIVERSATMREMLASSKRMAEYMHYVIGRKRDNIWIAQREGRAKDSDDRTQQSVLKMMAMGGEGGTIAEKLMGLHIVPLAISYEYDPCDYLKAQEFQLKRDVPGWKKTKQDDLLSMQTGILGYKGHIHYHCAPCIDGYLATLPADMPKGGVFEAVAQHIDRCIHLNYRLYPINYAAADLLSATDEFAQHYTADERSAFERYVDGQVAKVSIANKDDDYLRERILTMYANPVRNQKAAQAAPRP